MNNWLDFVISINNSIYKFNNYASHKNQYKNSKVFEQKGDLLSFKVYIDPKSGLIVSCAEPS